MQVYPKVRHGAPDPPSELCSTANQPKRFRLRERFDIIQNF